MSSGAAAAQNEASGPGATVDEEALLVSEFPPPPFYYKAASLSPPEIPTEALQRGSNRAAAVAAKAKAEAERVRSQLGEGDKTDAILGGEVEQEEEEGEVVAVFGEISEDPLLVQVEDVCEDPKKIAEEVKRLNREAVKGFLVLVQDLVHRPLDNKKRRDELSHSIFLMLQECNKFREHQAREILIELLEKQLQERRKVLEEIQRHISIADELLPQKDCLTMGPS